MWPSMATRGSNEISTRRCAQIWSVMSIVRLGGLRSAACRVKRSRCSAGLWVWERRAEARSRRGGQRRRGGRGGVIAFQIVGSRSSRCRLPAREERRRLGVQRGRHRALLMNADREGDATADRRARRLKPRQHTRLRLLQRCTRQGRWRWHWSTWNLPWNLHNDSCSDW